MRFKKPIFLMAYPSAIKILKNLTLFDEKLILVGEERYFLKKELHGPWGFIETFVFSDICPIIYLLDKDNHFWIYDLKAERAEKVKYVGGIGEEPGKFSKPRDMCVWKNILFVIDKNCLQALSLLTWQVIWVVGPQKDSYGHNLGGFSPQSLATDSLGNVYILDGSQKRVLKFNLAGELKKVIWEGALKKPVSIAVNENILYLLDSAKILKGTQTINLPETIDLPAAFGINTKGNIYLGSDKTNEDEGSLWGLDPQGELIDTVITYQRACKKIVFDKKDNLWVLSPKGILSLITPEKVYQERGELIHVFDSTIPKCEWHRLIIEAKIPEGTSLNLEVAAKEGGKDKISNYSLSFSNSKDIFLSQIKGRYLVVKIRFQSDPQRKKTPILNFIKVFFPKNTYLQYLPAIYQEDKESKDVLERYLSIFQNILEGIENKIEKTHLLIDPETAKGEFLNWLSSWVGLVREERWSEDKWRLLLAKAIEFFKRRGTREGLTNLIELYTGETPIVIEPFQLECGKERPLKLGNFSFCVFLKPKQIKNAEELEAVKRIVALWKPAHTEGKTVWLKERILLGGLVFLGVNTYLNPPAFILGKAVLPIETKLSDTEDNAQLECHARLGIDTKINF